MPMIALPGLGVYSAASGTIALNDPGTSAVGRWLLDIAVSGTAAITVTKRLRVDTTVTAHTPGNCWYTNALTNAAVAAGVAIAASGVYDVDASGCDVILTYTTSAGGTFELFATPLLG